MGKPTGFMEYGRVEGRQRPVEERIRDYREVALPLPPEELVREAARCMDCGTPFCHSLGCPVGNLIPEWNDAVYRGNWYEAWQRLEMANSFPEFTGRVCPAPCEASCTLAINSSPVAIRSLELAIIQKAFASGWVVPLPPRRESGRRVAIIGSGPAGLAAAQTLRRRGHRVSLFEKASRIGGLLRFGIPDFKLDKAVLDRRLEQMAREGVEFETGVVIGEDLSVRYLRRRFDVVLLAVGAGMPRDIAVPGRALAGIHFALDFLSQANRRVAGQAAGEAAGQAGITAQDKRVLVVGGGDTGSDCVGTAVRQGARSVTQIEILLEPPTWQSPANPGWPRWPNVLRTSSSHQEGCRRMWGVSVTQFGGGAEPGVRSARCKGVEWSEPRQGARPEAVEVPGSEFELEAELVLLAMGFVHVEHGRLLEELGVAFDPKGNIAVGADYMTTVPGVFSAGDAHAGASLVVRAIGHGRRAAAAIDAYLAGLG
ncbi:MAG: glutamate synthase subunit beta [Spirochaetales bacterium]|nr:glutamate synthase subunit beta [Spirochaetales bacterium]